MYKAVILAASAGTSKQYFTLAQEFCKSNSFDQAWRHINFLLYQIIDLPPFSVGSIVHSCDIW
jgi:hypothetical protein